MARRVSFLAFFLIWAERQRWVVPEIHVRACHWLEHRGRLAVLRCFRGFAKSTILAVYNAWLFYNDPTERILHQGESDKLAWRTSRDTQHVLRNHPLTKGMLAEGKKSVQEWWLPAGMQNDPRNASFNASGIMSNVTGSRSTEIQNDDVEVPRNIQNPDARERLRYRLGEQVHIAIPGAPRLFVGTPHTHDSIYDDMERLGADCLTIKLFEREHRIDFASRFFYPLDFEPEFVFAGIGEPSRLLEAGVDYEMAPGGIRFAVPPATLVDCYSGCAWPERFDRAELTNRRKETRTVNEWDSQYQLHSKPVHEIRLDPDRMVPYAAELVLERANRTVRLMLGQAQIISSRAYWDPSKGKTGNDTSALALILDDANGNQYWHCAEGVAGELAEFADHTNGRIVGGQVMQIVALVKRFHIPSVYVETNGLGAFIRPILVRALRQEDVVCGVVEIQVGPTKKSARILAAIEPPLSSGVLWAHSRVLAGPAYDQMKDWVPDEEGQADDFIDAAAGAMTQTPVRIGRNGMTVQPEATEDWRPRAGTPEVIFER